MYVHRNENHPYSCTMISPSAPPIVEEFFYFTSTSASPKKDHDHLEESYDSPANTTTRTVPSYHTGMLAPSPISADHTELQTNRESLPHNVARQEYESTPPPPYQVTVPLLAAAEDDEEPSALRQSPSNNIVEYGESKSAQYYPYAPSRRNFFSPFCFTFSVLFFILGLALVIGSVVIKHHCQRKCDVSERGSDEYVASPDCPDICFSITDEILRDGGAAITAVAGFATVCQLFLLSMWQMYTCCLPCCSTRK